MYLKSPYFADLSVSLKCFCVELYATQIIHKTGKTKRPPTPSEKRPVTAQITFKMKEDNKTPVLTRSTSCKHEPKSLTVCL